VLTYLVVWKGVATVAAGSTFFTLLFRFGTLFYLPITNAMANPIIPNVLRNSKI
jgi:hypothetical protein